MPCLVKSRLQNLICKLDFMALCTVILKYFDLNCRISAHLQHCVMNSKQQQLMALISHRFLLFFTQRKLYIITEASHKNNLTGQCEVYRGQYLTGLNQRIGGEAVRLARTWLQLLVNERPIGLILTLIRGLHPRLRQRPLLLMLLWPLWPPILGAVMIITFLL